MIFPSVLSHDMYILLRSLELETRARRDGALNQNQRQVAPRTGRSTDETRLHPLDVMSSPGPLTSFRHCGEGRGGGGAKLGWKRREWSVYGCFDFALSQS